MKATHMVARAPQLSGDAMKATEAPSLSFGEASPNDREGASPLVVRSTRRTTILLRGSAHEADEYDIVPGRSPGQCRPRRRAEGE